MNKKWYISALVILLALLGGFATHEQNQIPNQEIVVQFSDSKVSDDDAQEAISSVKQRLKAIGVHDITVTDFEFGRLKITYFSDKDVASIKKILIDEQSKIRGKDVPFEWPTEQNHIVYNLDVYEIQNGYDHALQLFGKLGIEHNKDNDRLSNSNTFANSNPNDYSLIELKINIAYRFHSQIGITIDHITHKIPEVRAGPFSQG